MFDRRKLESQMGNSLPRPSLLMKRNYVRKTEAVDEILGKGDKFGNEGRRYPRGGGGGGGCGERGGRRRGGGPEISWRNDEISEI